MWCDEAINDGLAQLAARQRRRALRGLTPLAGGRVVTPEGRVLLDVASNDALGLAHHPALKARAAVWIERFGTGAGASRLVTGTLEAVLELEQRLAAFVGAQAALLFNSGWQANSSVLPALFELAGRGQTPAVFADRLIHASLHAGCQGVTQQRYDHNDLAALERLLAASPPAARRFIITESVFSMDGDRVAVAALANLAQRFDCLLYIDEAHALGILGAGGAGLTAMLGAHPQLVRMGTLGKAFGAAGAFVAGSATLIDWLINRCKGFIYSTAPSPAVCGAVEAALDLMPQLDGDRARLLSRADSLRVRLQTLGLDTLDSTTHIVPVVLGSEQRALEAQEKLLAAGVLCVAIRPPTVPPGSARLRVSLNTAQTDADFAYLLEAVACLAP